MVDSSAPTHVIAHLSDTHFLADSARLYGVVDTDSTLARALAQLERSEIALDALVFTGDITDLGQRDAYERIRAIVEPAAARMGAQLVWVMGNHDSRRRMRVELLGEGKADGEGDAEGEGDEPVDRVFDLNGLRMIALDTSVPGFHHGELTAKQLEWLAAELSTPAAHGTVVALHHPPIPTSLPLMPILELQEQELLAAVIRGTDVRGILGGHLHYSTTSLFAGVPISVAAATCYVMDLTAGPHRLAGVGGGQSFNLVHLYPEQVVHSVVPIGDHAFVNDFPVDQVKRIEALSPEGRREAFSRHAPTTS
ncbi:phosphodiesterase [Subtercola boreus]|uniref:Phosphodiesterase n=1 Tax=Subtercola boreus TaxID=120213 RepID=A0A3E0WF21_9MICO|nr:phosphodiesterase [Subtercola boreus]RFA22032.1 phosphodiesterase [Subtercola boreus]RFA22212.1 phosphodiesterase [Subtercola boreus]RFA28074.1 phosphodiesterase [Subtercola boreus]